MARVSHVIFFCLLLSLCQCDKLPEKWGKKHHHYELKRSITQKRAINAADTKDVCTSSCKKATSEMLILMDHQSNDCEQFHELVCGGKPNNKKETFVRKQFSRINKFLNEDNAENNLPPEYNFFSTFHTSCLNYDMDFDFIDRMKFVNNYSETNLTKIFTDMILTQSMPFFDIGMEIERVNSSTTSYIFQITLPNQSFLKTTTGILQPLENIKMRCLELIEKSSLDLNVLYSKFKECVNKSFRRRMENYLEDATYFLGESCITVKDELVMEFLDKIERILPSSKEIQQNRIEKSFQSFTIAELTKQYGLINWEIFFNELSNHTHSNDEKIKVYFPKYIKGLFDIFGSYSRRDVNSSENLLTRILGSLYSYQLYQNTIIPQQKEDRAFYCMDLTTQLMPDLTTNIMYTILDKTELHDKSFLTQQLFHSLKEKLAASFESSALDMKVKDIFVKRLNELNLGIISSVFLLHTDSLNIDENQYQENVVKVLKRFRSNLYALVGSKVSRSNLLTYFVSPFDLEPKAIYGTNLIVLHPTMLFTTPRDLPEHITLAKKGIHFAREIIKHFDLIGKWYLNITENSMVEVDKYYNTLTKQTQDLIGKFYLASPYVLNGKNLTFQKIEDTLLVNELIVDSGAINLLTHRLGNKTTLPNMSPIENSYSPMKIFFIITAQEFCQRSTPELFMFDLYESHTLPSEIKIQNIISSSEKFMDIFGCPEGSLLTKEVIVHFPNLQKSEEENYEYEYLDVDDRSNN